MDSKRNTISSVVIGFIFIMISNSYAGPENNNVRIYAQKCFAKIDIVSNDIPRSMNCLDGDKIGVTRYKKNIAKESCSLINLRGSCDLPIKCDQHAWLEGSCYGNSYLTTFKAKSNSDVTIAFLCRHKTRNTDQPRRFDDIAMILHNKKNGETCWFQTRNGPGVSINGLHVPNPTRRLATLFWQKPKTTFSQGCIDCHDSGPFIISPWINQVSGKTLAKIRYANKTKYKNTTPPFDKWLEPVFISVGRLGLKNGDKSCTHCHFIATENTCAEWIDLSIGNDIPYMDKDLSWKNPHHHYFMPPKSMTVPLTGKYKKTKLLDRYKKHVDALKNCCQKFNSNRNYKGDRFCKKDRL